MATQGTRVHTARGPSRTAESVQRAHIHLAYIIADVVVGIRCTVELVLGRLASGGEHASQSARGGAESDAMQTQGMCPHACALQLHNMRPCLQHAACLHQMAYVLDRAPRLSVTRRAWRRPPRWSGSRPGRRSWPRRSAVAGHIVACLWLACSTVKAGLGRPLMLACKCESITVSAAYKGVLRLALHPGESTKAEVPSQHCVAMRRCHHNIMCHAVA